MVAAPELPSPGDWGWKRKDPCGWEVHWTTYQKQPRHVVNSSSVGARRGAAKEGASVPKHHFSALPFATVVDHVLRTNQHYEFFFF